MHFLAAKEELHPLYFASSARRKGGTVLAGLSRRYLITLKASRLWSGTPLDSPCA